MKYWLIMVRINNFFIGIVVILAACSGPWMDKNKIPEEITPNTIVLYDWEGDIPFSVIHSFTEETGINVKYITYGSDIEAEMNMYYRNGDFDVVVIDNDAIPLLKEQNLLAPLNYENVPNFRYISINFRDLVYDPDNIYSIPFNWGTTGLIYLDNDKFVPPSAWADLWVYPETVKIGLREDLPYDNLALTKKVLGESINECAPVVLDRVKERILELRSKIVFVDADSEMAIDELEDGKIDILVGWSDDVFEARDRNLEAQYVLPDEGTMLWGDSFVIPLRSRHKAEAESFINYLLVPENAALILEYNNYASANDSVSSFLSGELKNDSIIFPTDDAMYLSEIYLPVSDECNFQQINLWKDIVSEIE